MSSYPKNSPSTPRIGLAVLLALAAVYVIWGSTYLAIRFAVDGFPPLAMSAIRFSSAGLMLYGWLRFRGWDRPTLTQWKNAGLIGVLMLFGGVGLVAVAEDGGVGSGVAATAIAAVPLWAALWSRVFGEETTRLEAVGIGIGFIGVAVLATAGDLTVTPLGTVLILVSPVLWSLGSVWSKTLDLPKGAMATAAEMLTGGAALGIGAVVFGERITAVPQLSAWAALVYLTVFGSVVAFSAYMYLLRNVRPALATSYAYVNPAVAVFLGVTLGGEVVSGRSVASLPIILLGVALVASERFRPPRPRPQMIVRPAEAG